MSAENPQIRLEDVSKSYGSHVVLAGTDLEIRAGEFVVVVGRSGSGKSTLLNLIGGLDFPTSGDVEVLGQHLNLLTEDQRSALRCRNLGFVFQFFNLIPTLTVAENIRLPMALNGHDKKAAEERVSVLLAELGLIGCGERYPEELSGGEQQRIAVARAMAHQPAIVLADEPTGNLDLDTAREVLDLLDQSCRTLGTTLIMATHSTEVIGIADRVLTIRDSHLLEANP
ncbi:MAG TPA: ABC transporter ATP-binding protein [Gammaproteobacteria bacterium]